MSKIFILLLSVFGFLVVNAQISNRCGTRIENTEQFEQWLSFKQSKSAKKQISLYRVPVVVHVLHLGEPIGEGCNYSTERIEGQIRTLNEDFRRKEGTPGFNSHPDGGDTHIEFILAQIDPDGDLTNGIVRINMNSVQVPPLPPGTGDAITSSAQYSYWDPEQYLNIWCMPLDSHPAFF
jgi:hypothetical protein